MSKKIIFIILILVAAVFAGLWYFGIIKSPNNINQQGGKFKQTVKRNLTVEQKEVYQNRLREANKQLEELNSRKGVISAQEFFSAYWNIGTQYYGLGELGKAREFYEKAIAANEQNYNGYTALYTVALEQGDFETALSAIEKAAAIKPIDVDVWKNLIVLKEEKFKANFEEIDGLYKQALDKTGKAVDIVASYASFLEKQGKLKEALAQWKEAASLRPESQQYKNEVIRIEALLK